MRNFLPIIFTTLLVTFFISCSEEESLSPEQQKDTFIKTFGSSECHEHGWSVQVTKDNNIIIVGSKSSNEFSNDDVWLIKTDLYGNEIWSKTYGGDKTDNAFFVNLTSDSGYIITGKTNSFGAGQDDLWLIRTDQNGIKIWSTTFGSTGYEYGWSVQETSDGGFIVTGATTSYDVDSNPRLYLIKTDQYGNEEWTKTFGCIGIAGGASVAETIDNGFIITGEISPLTSDRDIWLIKTDSLGNEVWNKTFGGSDSESAYSLLQTSDGGFIITGYTRSFALGYRDVWLVKTDSNGNELWNKTFGTAEYDESGNSIQFTKDGGYIIAGTSTDDVLLIKTDADGNEIWYKTYSSDADYNGHSVKQTNDGGFVVTGTKFENSEYDVLLIKTDSEGNIE